MAKGADDPRLDPRIRAMLSAMPVPEPNEATTREEMVARANTPEADQRAALVQQLFASIDAEPIARKDSISRFTASARSRMETR